MVRMVRVSSRMKMSRSALSCRWLSSAFFSVTMFSMALSSWGEDARHTQMHTDRLTSTSSHSVLVALQALLTVTLNTMSVSFQSNAPVSSRGTANFGANIIHELGGVQSRKTTATEESIPARKWKLFFFQKVYNVYFSVKAPWRQVACLNPLSRTHRGFTYCL